MTTLVGTANGLHRVGDASRQDLLGREIRCIQGRGSRLWAVVDRSELWSGSLADGWHKANEIPGGLALCLLVQEDRIIVGSSDLTVHIYNPDDGRLLDRGDFQEVEGREEWYSPGQPSPEVRSLDGEADGTIYANVHVGGILRWLKHPRDAIPTLDFHRDVHQVLFEPTRGLLLGASAEGLAISSDRGASWRMETEGLHASYLRAVGVAGDTLLVTCSTGPGSRKGAVYRRALEGSGAFERCREGLPEWFPGNINTYCLDAEGDDIAFGSPEGDVYASSDRGESWRRIVRSLDPIKTVKLVS